MAATCLAGGMQSHVPAPATDVVHFTGLNEFLRLRFNVHLPIQLVYTFANLHITPVNPHLPALVRRSVLAFIPLEHLAVHFAA